MWILYYGVLHVDVVYAEGLSKHARPWRRFFTCHPISLLGSVCLVSAYLVLVLAIIWDWRVCRKKVWTFWVAATICAIAQGSWRLIFMLRAFQSSSLLWGTFAVLKTEARVSGLIGLPLLHYTLNVWGLGVGNCICGYWVRLSWALKWKILGQVIKRRFLCVFGLGSGLVLLCDSRRSTASIASHALSGSLILVAGVTLCYVLAFCSPSFV